ncbi:DUF2946 family protein [Altericroceibacterium endophyticum]|uniref:DUF2946 domain-containing protein n=1 Tax=Altericroceibacterium endophyticum TaxID=1808508 RepID=A0A6I4T703_9SPHN|nr:DUF2946 family protein [Altericroceibacterium endophyticum]MXO66726.1 hypothetical protein [Altericroceibacterium endophyticum]
MQPLRASIRNHRNLALALFLLAFLIRAMIPAGFMLSSSSGDTSLTVTICSDPANGLQRIQMAIPAKEPTGKHTDGMKKVEHCAFSGLAKIADSGADAFLLVLAFVFIVLIGLAPVRRERLTHFSHLRPPLRGPPLST